MTDQPLSFVLLSYFPRGETNPDVQLPLLVYRGRAGLEVAIRRGWETAVDAEDREYLTGLMADWSGAVADEIPDLLQQLAELSIGPLQAVESGSMDSKRRDMLLDQVSSVR